MSKLDDFHTVASIVPDLLGLNVLDARALCDARGLIATSSDSDGPTLLARTWNAKWVVIAQSPDPDVRVERGSFVRLEVRNENGGSLAFVESPIAPLGPGRQLITEHLAEEAAKASSTPVRNGKA